MQELIPKNRIYFPKTGSPAYRSSSRTGDDLLNEVQERAHLGRRQAARGVIGVEWKALLRPLREDAAQPASRQQGFEADREALENALTGQARRDGDGRVIHDQPAGDLDLPRLAAATKLPGKRQAGLGV